MAVKTWDAVKDSAGTSFYDSKEVWRTFSLTNGYAYVVSYSSNNLGFSQLRTMIVIFRTLWLLMLRLKSGWWNRTFKSQTIYTNFLHFESKTLTDSFFGDNLFNLLTGRPRVRRAVQRITKQTRNSGRGIATNCWMRCLQILCPNRSENLLVRSIILNITGLSPPPLICLVCGSHCSLENTRHLLTCRKTLRWCLETRSNSTRIPNRKFWP